MHPVAVATPPWRQWRCRPLPSSRCSSSSSSPICEAGSRLGRQCHHCFAAALLRGALPEAGRGERRVRGLRSRRHAEGELAAEVLVVGRHGQLQAHVLRKKLLQRDNGSERADERGSGRKGRTGAQRSERKRWLAWCDGMVPRNSRSHNSGHNWSAC
jgi:hypothetical protein